MEPNQGMLNQLDSKVQGMRSQAMIFSNNGIEFQLHVPDTKDVKDTLGSFVTTIVEQKNTIDSLTSDISRMAKAHDESIASIMAWATQCITELKNQNAGIESQLKDAVLKLENFSYNMQGYADKDDVIPEVDEVLFPSLPPSGHASVRPSRAPSAYDIHTSEHHTPKLKSPEPPPAPAPAPAPQPEPIQLGEVISPRVASPKPQASARAATPSEPEPAAPAVVVPEPPPPPAAAAAEGETDEKPVIFFPTEHPEGEPAKPSTPITKVSSTSASTSRQSPEPPGESSTREVQEQEHGDRVTALPRIHSPHTYSHAFGKPKPRKRANSTLYLATPLVKVPKSARGRWLWAFNIVKKMLRMRTQKISMTRTRVVKGQSVLDRIERLESELFNVTNELARVNAARKEELELIDRLMNPPKPPTPEPEPEPELLPEPEPEPEPIVLRSVNVEKIQSRVYKLTDRATQLKDSMESLAKITPYLVEQSNKFQEPRNHTDGDAVQTYLKLDAEIRTTQSELRICEANCFLMEELVSELATEVASYTDHSDYDEESTEAVHTLGQTMAELVAMMDTSKFDISKTADLLFLNSAIFAKNWDQFVHLLQSAPSNSTLMLGIDKLNVSVRETKEHVFELDERVAKIEDSEIMNPPPPVENANAADKQDVPLPEKWSEMLTPLVKDMIDAYLEANVGALPISGGGGRSRPNSRRSNHSQKGDSEHGDDGPGGDTGEGEGGGGELRDGENADGDSGAEGVPAGEVGMSDTLNAGDEGAEGVGRSSPGGQDPAIAAAEAAAKKAKADDAKAKMLAKKKEAALLVQQQAEAKVAAEAEAKALKKQQQQERQQQLLEQARQAQEHAAQQSQQQQQIASKAGSPDPNLPGGGGDAGGDDTDLFNAAGSVPGSRRSSLVANNNADASGSSKPGSLTGKGPKGGKAPKKSLISANKPARNSPIDDGGDDQQSPRHQPSASNLLRDISGITLQQSDSHLGLNDDMDDDANGATAGNDMSLTVTKIRPKKKEQPSIREMLKKQQSTTSAAGSEGTGTGGSAELALLVRKMEELYQDKLDTEKGLEMLATKANANELHNKVDYDMFEAVERSLQSITEEMGDLRRLQRQELDRVRNSLQRSLMKALGNIMAQRSSGDVEPGVSSLSTKALCLNCGREAIARPVPMIHYQAPAHPNALITHSLPGADVHRGGFKLPVYKAPPHSLSNLSSVMDDENNDGGGEGGGGNDANNGGDGNNINDLGLGSLSTELGPLSPLQPTRSLKSAGNMMSQSVPAGGMTALKVVKAIRHAQGREEATQLRPIYRKGFPARKTLKADAPYGAEIRLDMSNAPLQIKY